MTGRNELGHAGRPSDDAVARVSASSASVNPGGQRGARSSVAPLASRRHGLWGVMVGPMAFLSLAGARGYVDALDTPSCPGCGAAWHSCGLACVDVCGECGARASEGGCHPADAVELAEALLGFIETPDDAPWPDDTDALGDEHECQPCPICDAPCVACYPDHTNNQEHNNP